MAFRQEANLSPAAWIAVIGVSAVGYGMLYGLQAWRLSTFDRTIATVVALHDEERPSRGAPRYVTVGVLTFERVDKQGRTFKCRHAFDIGSPADGYVLGDRIEIVPATGSCARADIIGRPDTP